MRLLKQFLIILMITFLGEGLKYILPLPNIPCEKCVQCMVWIMTEQVAFGLRSNKSNLMADWIYIKGKCLTWQTQ